VHIFRWLILFALLIAASPIAASDDCELEEEDIPAQEWEDLVDVLMFPGCESITAPVAAELAGRIQRKQWPHGTDSDELMMTQLAVAVARLHDALWEQDLPLARRLLIESVAVAEQVDAALESGDGHAAVEDGSAQWTLRLQQVRRIIDGRYTASASKATQTVPAEWAIEFNRCGTPVVFFVVQAMLSVVVADAYAAVGKPELGLQHLLSEQWVDAMSLRVAPPRLRAFATRAFGPEAYAQEVEAALQGIRIEDAVNGRFAYMPIFGLWLPVPLGEQGGVSGPSVRFDTREQVADYLRPILLDDG
jgi:hypothetical protein